MTAMLSSVAFPRLADVRADDVRADDMRADDMRADDLRADGAHPDGAAADTGLADPAGTAAVDAPAPRQSAASPVRVLGLAAMAGVLAAGVAVLAARQWLPPRPYDDPRLAQLLRQNGELTEQLQSLAQKVRTLETEGVAGADATDALASRVAGQTAALGTLKAALQQLVDGSAAAAADQRSGTSAALFGVAVVQLRDAIEQGRPFDWELVDVRGIAGNDATLLRELHRLAPLAAGGVATAAQLRQGLRLLTDAEAQRGGASLVQAGLDIVGRAFGPTLVALPANANPTLLQQASLLMDQRDMAGTVRELRALTGDSAESARPLIEAAEKRAIALAAVDVLQDAARGRLQTQLRAATRSAAIP